ncbi:MAG TPA: hypothetical protein VH325_13580 [Bryobacteraceae bacterium]|nr:hypothetical protein [Bryobacteraceae bacterium]
MPNAQAVRSVFALLWFCLAPSLGVASGLRFEVTIPANTSNRPHNGHLVLLLSRDTSSEPRFEFTPYVISSQFVDPFQDLHFRASQQAFGVDVEDLPTGRPVIVDQDAVGFPAERIADLPAGDFSVQAVFNVYEEFHLASGKTVKLPPDKGEGQHWATKPGNPYSTPAMMHIDPREFSTIRITLDKVVPAITPEPDTNYIRHIRIRSEKLSRFWGRDVYLGANVLLPEGWNTHPAAHYPLIVYQSHYPGYRPANVEFRTTPPGPEITGRALAQAQYGYRLYQDWAQDRLPHVLLISIQHANPYFDDSYAVNSANLGPYGDAIIEELIPEVEKRFRGIGQGWARATYGGSTGAWECIASQILYPDFYNGVWTNGPDATDFHALQNVDLYKDVNAYYRTGPWGGRVPIASQRLPDGTIINEMELDNRYEYVQGTHGRAGQQWDILQAVFSPAGQDGYPQPIFDKRTGMIDKQVAAYWHDHYDLDVILQRDWKTLGPRLQGKLHFIAGESDRYFQNNDVHLMETFLRGTENPHSDATFDYGFRRGHEYTGAAELTSAEASGTQVQRLIPKMVDRFLATAPAGADTASWRY